MRHGIGLICGMLGGGALGIGVVMLLFKKKVLDCTFDERQELARGVAFKRAFFTLLVCLTAYGLSDTCFGRWCDALTGAVLCICAAMVVFAVTCITRDAYMSLKEKPRQVMALFTVLTLANLAIGVGNLLNGGVVENGILTYRSVNLMVGILTGVILAVYVADHLLAGREEAE